MAFQDDIQNKLAGMLNGGYQGSEGYRFGRDQALQAVQRGTQRGSGNQLAALAKMGAGYAQQDYGNEFQRMAGLLGQEQGNTLGQGQLALGNRTADQSFQLGQGQLALGNKTADNQFALGNTNAGNTRRANDQQFGLGMFNGVNNYNLGQQRNANDWWSNNANANTNWFNAQTNARNGQNTWNLNAWNAMQ